MLLVLCFIWLSTDKDFYYSLWTLPVIQSPIQCTVDAPVYLLLIAFLHTQAGHSQVLHSLSGMDRVHSKVQDFLVKFGELLPTIFVSTL